MELDNFEEIIETKISIIYTVTHLKDKKFVLGSKDRIVVYELYRGIICESELINNEPMFAMEKVRKDEIACCTTQSVILFKLSLNLESSA